jgi:hypothetical protein
MFPAGKDLAEKKCTEELTTPQSVEQKMNNIRNRSTI